MLIDPVIFVLHMNTRNTDLFFWLKNENKVIFTFLPRVWCQLLPRAGSSTVQPIPGPLANGGLGFTSTECVLWKLSKLGAACRVK